ncbi:MAG: hypothetical protein ACI93N_002577 [Flavobacteriaceae bacterium]|jgi:hypothetical protein
MKKLIIIIIIILIWFPLIFSSCSKDKCITDIKENFDEFTYFNRYQCISGEFEKKYNTYESFISDPSCHWNNGGIPVPLDFEGIIISQGVKVPYAGPNGGDPGYSLSVDIAKDNCEKFIDFKFILTTIDTARRLEHYQKVLVVLDGIDSTYQVNFSHEIIPYTE